MHQDTLVSLELTEVRVSEIRRSEEWYLFTLEDPVMPIWPIFWPYRSTPLYVQWIIHLHIRVTPQTRQDQISLHSSRWNNTHIPIDRCINIKCMNKDKQHLCTALQSANTRGDPLPFLCCSFLCKPLVWRPPRAPWCQLKKGKSLALSSWFTLQPSSRKTGELSDCVC